MWWWCRSYACVCACVCLPLCVKNNRQQLALTALWSGPGRSTSFKFIHNFGIANLGSSAHLAALLPAQQRLQLVHLNVPAAIHVQGVKGALNQRVPLPGLLDLRRKGELSAVGSLATPLAGELHSSVLHSAGACKCGIGEKRQGERKH